MAAQLGTNSSMGVGESLPPVDVGSVHARLRSLAERGELAARAYDFCHARELLDAAYVLATALGATEHVAESLSGLGLVAHIRGDINAAEALYTRALEVMTDPRRRSAVGARLGFARYDRGDLDGADAIFDAAMADAPEEACRARIIGYRGNLARARGDNARAVALYDAAVHACERAGDVRYAATFTMDRAISELLLGEERTALLRLEDLARDEVVLRDAQLTSLVSHYAAVARARLGLPETRSVGGSELPIVGYLERARQLMRSATRWGLARLEEEAPANAHARITLQLIESFTQRRRAMSGSRSLVVARNGTSFRLGDDDVVSLAQRPLLARLLLTLARARIANPGVPLSGERLAEAVWPGERMLPAARKNRLHVAIATLRSLGLRPVLQSSAAGYRVDRDVAVVIVD